MNTQYLLLALIAVCAVGFWYLIDAVNCGVNDILTRFERHEHALEALNDTIAHRLDDLIHHCSAASESAASLEANFAPDGTNYDAGLESP